MLEIIQAWIEIRVLKIAARDAHNCNAKLTASSTLLLPTATGLANPGTVYEAISRMGSPARAAIRFTSFLGLKNV